MLLAEQLTERVIGLAIEVHRHTGPGLLEAVYAQCLCHELRQSGLQFARQVLIPVTYKGVPINEGFKADTLLIDNSYLRSRSLPPSCPCTRRNCTRICV